MVRLNVTGRGFVRSPSKFCCTFTNAFYRLFGGWTHEINPRSGNVPTGKQDKVKANAWNLIHVYSEDVAAIVDIWKKKKEALVLRAPQESSVLTNGIQINIPTRQINGNSTLLKCKVHRAFKMFLEKLKSRAGRRFGYSPSKTLYWAFSWILFNWFWIYSTHWQTILLVLVFAYA